MFTSFHSLASKPFTKEIKPEQMFASSSQQELLAREETRGFGWNGSDSVLRTL